MIALALALARGLARACATACGHMTYEDLDNFYGKTFLGALQKHVLTGSHDHPRHKSDERVLNKRQQRLSLRGCLSGAVTAQEEVPTHVKKAYASRRLRQAYWQGICRQALKRSQAAVRSCHEVDVDGVLAWQLHREESRAFVENLNPWSPDVGRAKFPHNESICSF